MASFLRPLSSNAPAGVGRPVPRLEDARLVTGRGRYSDDVNLPGGEGGTTPALGVVINAIVDALGELGVEHVEMPATPERVWRAIEEARARQ